MEEKTSEFGKEGDLVPQNVQHIVKTAALLKILFLDWGGVIGGFSPDRFIKKLAMIFYTDYLRMSEFLYMHREETGMKIWEIIETQMSAEEIYETFCKHFHQRPPRDIFEYAFNAGLEVNSEHWINFVEVMEKVKAKGYLLGLISNVNHIHWKVISGTTFGYTLQFMEKDLIYASCKAGLRKCEQGVMFDYVFEDAYKKYGVPRNNIFFADDKEENVRGCNRVGATAIQFEHGNISKFHANLIRVGFFDE